MRRAAVVLVALSAAVACSSAAPAPSVSIDKEVELSLASACVAAGGEQVLKVRAPHLAVAVFGTEYADGESGGPAPFGAGYGGGDSEIVPESGVVEMRWRISEEAPPGPVVVDVGILRDGQEERELTFTVVAPGEPC